MTGRRLLLSLGVAGMLAVVVLALERLGDSPAVRRPANFQILLAALAAVTALWALRARRDAVSIERLTAAAVALFYSLVVISLMGVHLFVIVASRTFLATQPFRYDFRFYSLLMLGVVSLVPALRLLRGSVRLHRSGGEGWKRVVKSVWILLAIHLPLMPIQEFAIAFSGGGVALLLVLAAVRPSASERKSPEARL